MKKVKKCCLTLAAALLAVISVWAAAVGIQRSCEQWKRDNSGIPDVVNSITSGETCRLTVVANSGSIGDADAFAGEVIRMYRENAFHSLRFSTDIGNGPEKLDIAVYLKKADIGEEEPVMRIVFFTGGKEDEYEIIRNDGERKAGDEK